MLFKPVILKGKETKDGRTNIKIHFFYKGRSKELATDFFVNPKEFLKGRVRKKNPNADYINIELKKKMLDYDRKLLGVNYHSWTADQVREFLKGSSSFLDDFWGYYEGRILFKSKINTRTSEIYQDTLTKIRTFEKREELRFSDITAMWLQRFDHFMDENDLKVNTRSIHLRNIRSIFNDAIDEEIIPLSTYPFRRYKIKYEKTDKKAIEIDQLKAVRDYKTELPGLAKVRDGFMLSFYLIGINNSDLYLLKEIDKEGRINYRRNKEEDQAELSVKVQPEALELIKLYPGSKNLLCYSDNYKEDKIMTTVFDKRLKTIGETVGVQDLTMSHARHTWASLAADKMNASDEDIDVALGHSIKTVASIYIKRNPDRVDKLKRGVLDLIL